MPLHLVELDIETGRLVRINVEGLPPQRMLRIKLCSAYRLDLPPRSADQWLLDHLASGWP